MAEEPILSRSPSVAASPEDAPSPTSPRDLHPLSKGPATAWDTTTATSPEDDSVPTPPQQEVRKPSEDAVEPKEAFTVGSKNDAVGPAVPSLEKDADQKKVSDIMVSTEEQQAASRRRTSILRERPDIHDGGETLP
ncbi:uncharacterized protein LOC144128769 [Amblyomma americanum]